MSKKKSNKSQVNKETNIQPKEEQTMTKFASMCGDEFDNKKSSSCTKMCKEENPEAYQACLANFKENKKPVKAAKPKVQKEKVVKETTPKPEKVVKEKVVKPKQEKLFDWFGDGAGTSASVINHMLILGATIEELKKVADCNKNRINGHFTGLRSGKRERRPMKFEIFRAKETNKYHLDHPDVDFETLTA